MANELQPYDSVEERLQEWGYPPPKPQNPGNLPPGGGQFVLPHVATFSQIVNMASKTYRWTFDEALRHSSVNTLAMRRDLVIMDALRSRQIPVVQLPWHLEADDDQDNKQVEAVKGLSRIIEEIHNFQDYKRQLMEAIWYGRYAVQNLYRWDFSTGKRRMIVGDYQPINGDKLVFRHGGGMGVLVHPAQYDGPTYITDRSRAHFFTPEEREQLVVHKHEPEDADFFEGELAGAIHGVGIRSRVYWIWWLRSQIMTFLMDYLERVGAGGFTIYFFESGNPESLREVRGAAEEQWRNNAILFPRYREGTAGGPGIQRVEPSMAGANLLESLVVNYFDNVIRRFILGQSLTSEAQGTGLGSGLADLHADTFNRIVKYDAIALQETLTRDLVSVLCKYNYPGIPCPRFIFDVDKPNAQAVLQAAQAFFEMGGAIDEDELRGIIGLAKPVPGHAILAQAQPMQPQGVGAMPQGVPMEGQPGPMPMGPGGPPQDQGLPFKSRGRVVRFAAKSPHPDLLNHAQGYMKTKGKEYPGEAMPYVSVGEDMAKSIGDYYQQSAHIPNDPKVQASYKALRQETIDQFNYLREQGVRFTPWTQEGQPYANSEEMLADVHQNQHLYFFPTASGFGEGEQAQDHPMLADTGIEEGGHKYLLNDMFRAVHDYFGHALYGNQFGPRGEEHAWRAHRKMYSDEAAPAMSYETRGQNSWVNYGPHMRRQDGSLYQKGDPEYQDVLTRPYAEQKANLLPDDLMKDHPE